MSSTSELPSISFSRASSWKTGASFGAVEPAGTATVATGAVVLTGTGLTAITYYGATFASGAAAIGLAAAGIETAFLTARAFAFSAKTFS